mmetsp:Transcript_35170/g.76866  ORF Transcript_35170/g.76866 Transcript_35170/m.76866 type:complete len:232 (+) Transcript_35170:1965-2660(+)
MSTTSCVRGGGHSTGEGRAQRLRDCASGCYNVRPTTRSCPITGSPLRPGAVEGSPDASLPGLRLHVRAGPVRPGEYPPLALPPRTQIAERSFWAPPPLTTTAHIASHPHTGVRKDGPKREDEGVREGEEVRGNVAFQESRRGVLSRALQPQLPSGNQRLQHPGMRAALQVGGRVQAHDTRPHERSCLQLLPAAPLLARSRAIQLALPHRGLRRSAKTLRYHSETRHTKQIK